MNNASTMNNASHNTKKDLSMPESAREVKNQSLRKRMSAEPEETVDADIGRNELEGINTYDYEQGENDQGQNGSPSTFETVKSTVKEHKTATVALAGAALAATLTALYFSGSKGRERKESAKEWMHHAKDDVATRVERAGEITREKYNAIVQSVAGSYESEGANQWDVHSFKRDLTSFWDEYADVIEDAKRAGKDVMVMIAEKLRDAETTSEAAQDIRQSLKHTAKEALRGAAFGTGKAAHEEGSKRNKSDRTMGIDDLDERDYDPNERY